MSNSDIIIKGARTNNLKNINVQIPKHKITVLTGVSGAGKSSLAFSTLASESQREINKNYSAYVQQLLPNYSKPEVDSIKNLPFSVVVTQKKLSGNARSTVGTYTDIYTTLRLLFSRKAVPFIGYSMVYSFNNPAGMCLRCEGLGYIQDISSEQILDKNLSLNQGAIKLPTFQPGGWRLTRYTDSGFFDNDLPLLNWDNETLNLFLYGAEQVPKNPLPKWHKTAKYVGLMPRIKKAFFNQENNKYDQQLKAIIQKSICPDCQGLRLNQAARSAKLAGKSIAECCMLSIDELEKWLSSVKSDGIETLVNDLFTKISNLMMVGLSYLSLNRGTSNLSGGEAQRIKLASHLNSALTDVLYIFDEPSVGLHPHDLIGIIDIFKLLKEKGNTLVIVDHDPDIIQIADHIINLGELAGESGGYVTFNGSYSQLLQSNTLTAEALNNPGTVNLPQPLKFEFFKLKHLKLHNLLDINVDIPKKALTVISGPAGSGKSSLVRSFIKQQDNITILNQNPIHANSRSNILTYLGVFDLLRKQFAHATKKPLSLFSFNGKGACPVCKGLGVIKLDLAYLGDATSICEACQGSRYSDEVLQASVNGYNIHQVLNLTASKIATLFPVLKSTMSVLQDCKLDYLKVGQSLNTLSGGELQRLKLTKCLLSKQSQIIVLDEPTSGLHEANIQELIDLLKNIILHRQLTILVVEHNLRFIGQADWDIDMGPGAGDNGGKVLFQGTPYELIKVGNTYTADALKQYFAN
ncbi:ATP-binding cassette domain-containing protein [Leuconostoc inhae]|uniref:ATP-binding cassette domain-containing protein n=1 Tax=Leuconostoc inhae TaxID=178001 RepID=UPI001C7D6C11|nr:ATP-binding cassette domain-containing protein [Leuconostoc inhae]